MGGGGIRGVAVVSAVKKTDAWMPLWIGAYLADTQHLTRDEHGAYFLLMMAYWRNGGPLPDDDKRLGAIVKASPKEWKALRPTLAEFFTIADGSWSQKRIDAELVAAKDRSKKNEARAKKAAQARWDTCQEDAPSNAPSIQEALPEDMLGQCPTSHISHLTPVPGTQPVVAEEENHLYPLMGMSGPSSAGAACLAMKSVGVADTSPGNAKLRALLDAGATVEEFVDAGRKAVAANAGFGYALKVVENGRKQAAQLAAQVHRGPLQAATHTNKQEALELRNRQVAAEWAAEGA